MIISQPVASTPCWGYFSTESTLPTTLTILPRDRFLFHAMSFNVNKVFSRVPPHISSDSVGHFLISGAYHCSGASSGNISFLQTRADFHHSNRKAFQTTEILWPIGREVCDLNSNCLLESGLGQGGTKRYSCDGTVSLEGNIMASVARHVCDQWDINSVRYLKLFIIIDVIRNIIFCAREVLMSAILSGDQGPNCQLGKWKKARLFKSDLLALVTVFNFFLVI